MDQLDALLVLTTWPANADPAILATTLVDERLAACVNLLPEMDSIYRWQGRVERDRERQVIIKTTRGRLEALKRRIATLHPYELPELIVLPIVEGSDAYLRWLADGAGGQ